MISMKRSFVVTVAGLLICTGLAVLPGTVASSAPSPNATWKQVDATPSGCTTACTGAPTGGPGGSMTYDPATHQLVLFGEDYGDGDSTWLWSGRAWKQVDDSSDPGCTTSCAGSPPDMNTFGMAYDPASGAVVVFGSNEYNDTWAWNGTSWRQVADATDHGCTSTCTASPPDLIGTQMAYDAATGQMVLFGGATGYSETPDDNETWVLSYRDATYTWKQVDDAHHAGCLSTCPSSPPGRNVAALAYDPATRDLVVFGGEQTGEEANGQNDTWIWNGATWQQVDDGNGVHQHCGESWPSLNACPTSPPGRVGSVMAFDPALGELVLFGGMNRYGEPEYNDTWAWNGGDWTQIDDNTDGGCTSSCTGSPLARDTFAMADDGATNQLVMFGGGNNYDDTWAAAAVPIVPSAPTHVSFVTVGTKVVVTWRTPTVAGPAPITGYEVTASPGNRTCSTSRVTRCTISGLSPHKRYKISVAAISGDGTGKAAVLRNVTG
jgi:hypothetical protein